MKNNPLITESRIKATNEALSKMAYYRYITKGSLEYKDPKMLKHMNEKHLAMAKDIMGSTK